MTNSAASPSTAVCLMLTQRKYLGADQSVMWAAGRGRLARIYTRRESMLVALICQRECCARHGGCTPDMTFTPGDMRALPFEDSALAGIVCFYAIIHLLREDVPVALAEMHRVIAPGGRLLLSFHGGEGEVGYDTFLDHDVPIAATLFTPAEVARYIAGAGFYVTGIWTRPAL